MKKLLILFLYLFVNVAFATGIGNVATAPCDNATLNKYTGTANVEINWEPNTINLNWYNGDEKLTVANASQTCTYDGMITVPAQPTKPGYTFNGWKVIHVPGGFTELEYIQSTGTQYINTGYVYPSNTTAHVIIDTLFTSLNGYNTNWKVHGVSGSAYGGPNVGISYDDTLCAATNGDFVTNVSAETNKRYIFDLDMPRRNFTVTDVATNNILVNRNDFPNTNRDAPNRPSFMLFGYFNPGAARNSSRIYRATLYDNEVLVRYMIPARRNSDNVLGMWDTVTQTFFTNAGTGAFVAGPAVQ